ncbi:tetratricopeptide repeat protein [Halegenticoccus soli]|uniref:tetratricopeptide repeat protein n=1 Tax=Halegenticoccus soli TaxID=1985678 RepID=UPI000C6E3498|nr:tetratricopeptide repeat protein [Halegenticoccus soli]
MRRKAAEDHAALVRLVTKRLGFLERLGSSRLEKRELVDELDCSRSTVDRAVRELELADLVRRVDGGYETTLAGELIADRHREYVGDVADVLDANPVLASLPAGAPVDAAMLLGADVRSVDDSTVDGVLDYVHRRVGDADGLRIVAPDGLDPRLLDVSRARIGEGEIPTELVADPALFTRYRPRLAGTVAAIAENDGEAAFSPETPPFALFLVERDGDRTALVVVHDGDRTVSGALGNGTDAAVRWAESLYDRVRADATDVTGRIDPTVDGGSAATEWDGGPDFFRGIAAARDADRSPPAAGRLGVPDGEFERVALESEGFVRLSETYFEGRRPAEPATCWRTGFDLVEVGAGYAIDREYERGGERRNLTDDLLDRLGDGVDHVVVGPPGSGKSTVCKSVACRWYREGRGAVFYRAGGDGTAFTNEAVLRAHLRRAEGHALVVVEDAVRSEANAALWLATAFRGRSDVTFLFDARDGEWRDPESLPIDAGVEVYRTDDVELVRVPGIDETECRRLVRRFEETTGRAVDATAEHLLREIRTGSSADSAAEARPDELLLLLHRLSLFADPLAGYDSNTSTSLLADIRRTLALLRDADGEGDLAMDVGVLVNLLNATGVGVHPELIHAVDDDHGAVRAALSLLEGSVLFGRDGPSEGGRPRYRTVHESWSTTFLTTLFERESLPAAQARFGRCVTALLSLADDAERRERIDWEFEGDAPRVAEIAASPREWADRIVERLFAFGREHPGLAPLFGKSGYSHIELPATCSPDLSVRCTKWRGRMCLDGGYFDRAEHEFERLRETVSGGPPPGVSASTAAELDAWGLRSLGALARRRGNLDRAEAYARRSLDRSREIDDTQGEADCLNHLGAVAWSRGDLDGAERYFSRSLDVKRDLGDRRGEANCLNNLGIVALVRGEIGAAETYLRRSLDARHELGDASGEASGLTNLGVIARDRGEYDAAATRATRSLDIWREIGDAHGEANGLFLLGQIERRRGNLETAAEYAARSLDVRRRIGDAHGEADSLRLRGELARERGETATGRARAEESLAIYREIGDDRGEAQALALLGGLACDAGDPAAAERHAEACLALRGDVTDRGVADALRVRGAAARGLGNREEARRHLERSLDICREKGYRHAEADARVELGALRRDGGDLVGAREQFDAAGAIYREIGAARDALSALRRLCAVSERLDGAAAAAERCEDALALAREAALDDEADAFEGELRRLRAGSDEAA